MPIYRFNLFNHVTVPDEDGRAFPDLMAARAYAIANIRDLAAHDAREGQLDLSHRIEIVDEQGRLCLALSFAIVLAGAGRGAPITSLPAEAAPSDEALSSAGAPTGVALNCNGHFVWLTPEAALETTRGMERAASAAIRLRPERHAVIDGDRS